MDRNSFGSERLSAPAAGVATVQSHLLDRIRTRTAKVAVIGLGYVGLPLAVEFARSGFEVTGFDVDESKISEIQGGRSYIPDVPGDQLRQEVEAGRLTATSDPSRLADV